MNNNFSERLRSSREDSGKTQAQVAEEINVSLNTYAHYERNNKKPAVKTFIALCLSLGVSANWLLSDVPTAHGLSPEQTEKLKAMDNRRLALILNLLQTMYENQRT